MDDEEFNKALMDSIVCGTGSLKDVVKEINMDLRKLDALVAEKVMGWVRLERQEQLEGKTWNGELFTVEQFRSLYSMDIAWLVNGELSLHSHPRYSSDIAAAWEVVEKVTEQFSEEEIVIVQDKSSVTKTRWWVTFSGDRMSALGEPLWVCGWDSLPLAICLAALRAKGIEVSEWEK